MTENLLLQQTLAIIRQCLVKLINTPEIKETIRCPPQTQKRVLVEYQHFILILFRNLKTGLIKRDDSAKNFTKGYENLCAVRDFKQKCPNFKKLVHYVMVYNPGNAKSERSTKYLQTILLSKENFSMTENSMLYPPFELEFCVDWEAS